MSCFAVCSYLSLLVSLSALNPIFKSFIYIICKRQRVSFPINLYFFRKFSLPRSLFYFEGKINFYSLSLSAIRKWRSLCLWRQQEVIQVCLHACMMKNSIKTQANPIRKWDDSFNMQISWNELGSIWIQFYQRLLLFPNGPINTQESSCTWVLFFS
jgi:hypothetical protein